MLTIRRAAAADQPQLMAIYRTAQEYMLQPEIPPSGAAPIRRRS